MTKSVFELLYDRYSDGAWSYLTEVRNATGFAHRTTFADALAFSMYESRGLELHGHEVKVSRADLLRELKDPMKSEPIQQFCDRWWLVLSDKDLIRPGELPPTWGLLVPSRGILRAAKAAPKLKAKPWTRAFIASILRRFSKDTVPRDVHAEVLASVNERAEERAKTLATGSRDEDTRHLTLRAEHAERELENLKASHAVFERLSGIHIGRWPTDGKFSAKVAQLALHLSQHGGDLERLAEQLEQAAVAARAAATATTLPEPPQPAPGISFDNGVADL